MALLVDTARCANETGYSLASPWNNLDVLEVERLSLELVHFSGLISAITKGLSKLILMKLTFLKVEIALIKIVGRGQYLRQSHSCVNGLFFPTP